MAKQVIVMRKDLNMTKGKMIAQGSHASLGVILSMMNNGVSVRHTVPITDEYGVYEMTLRVKMETPLDDWLRGMFKKICVYVKAEEELLAIHQLAIEAGLPVSLIEDSGLTMFKRVPTKTCLAIGPEDEQAIDAITGHLPLL